LYAVGNQLVALAVSSPLDVAHLSSLVGVRSLGRVSRVISRVFAFEGAPKNTISYLLSRVSQEERKAEVARLVTYVNPNMGFNGVSYRASGWGLIGEEAGTTYRYLDGRYVTERELQYRFGALSDAQYKQVLGLRFSVSRMPLLPLHVYSLQL
jgi:hypothetical protein